ncbi:MAG: MBL fold metallo-hydrolase [Bacteroidales bacterium]|nr:MBL fold metallo-hydrolase [Bacteroidales bacterium]
MKIHKIEAEVWKLDGGAMFGLVPKTIWGKQYPADENNLIHMSTRLMLIETDEGRKVLVDTGMGDKRGEKYYKYKYIIDSISLEDALKNKGFKVEDITDVVLTHLHDDHVGGAVKMNNSAFELVFPNAKYWLSEDQYNWAIKPNKREAGTYFPDNFLPIKEAGKLELVKKNGIYILGIEFRIYDGHTKGQILPMVDIDGKTFVFMADFIPFVASIPLPYVASVDVQPLITMTEKEAFLNEAADKNYYLFFEHDFYNEVCTVEHSFKRVALKKAYRLNELV